MYSYCDPCTVDYKYIIHFEKLAQETDFLKDVIDPTRTSDIYKKDHWLNNSKGGKLSDDEVVKVYFSQLDKEDILKLHK